MYGVINNAMGSGSVTYECEGNERRLVDCRRWLAPPATPCYYALVNCAPKTQVIVAQTSYDPKYGYYLTVQEADGNIQVCLQTNRVVTEPLHVHVETTHTNTTGNISHLPAIGRHDCTYFVFYLVPNSLHVMYIIYFYPLFSCSADYDYKTATHTLTFELSNERESQQQCLEIEIINDSLPEDWEVFTLLLSTNNSAVNLTTKRVDVRIQPNNGI